MKKRFLAMLLTLGLLVGALPAAAASDATAGYYGSQLKDPAAMAFYQVLETMDFKSGGNMSVDDPAVLSLAQGYAQGDDALMRQFGAAVDSFRYDHTEFFYVDWDMLSVKVGRRNGRFVVSVGTGRTDSYLRDKTADISAQTAAYDAALDALVAAVREKAGAGADVKAMAKAANAAVCDAVTYDFCDGSDAARYIRTAYGALVNSKAVCEGYSRLYKAVLDELGVECVLVSGYFLEGERFEPHMWNYVQDEEGHWYAVDVTMNDGHRLRGAATASEKYFWQTQELFAIDHMEDGKVSSVEYEMPYPALHRFWKSPTESGRFDYGIGTYEGAKAFWFSFDGKSAQQLMDEDGLYMALRTASTNAGTLEWSPWQSVQEYNRLIPDIAPSVENKTYFRGDNISMPILEVGVFDIPEDVQHSAFARVYSDEAVKTHLIEAVGVDNPSHDPDYIAPAYIAETTPAELFQRRQSILEKQHVELVYNMPLREVGDGLELTWDVSSYNNRDLSLEAVGKNARLENVKFDGDRTISFDFTPSRAYNHNMIFYHFTPRNMVNVLDDGRDGVALKDFAIMYEYKDSIACCKIYNDGRLYVNSYAQPTIAMNGDLSMTGWTYTDDDGTTRQVSEGQRSQLAMVVTRPQNSDALVDAVTDQVGQAAVAQSMTYEIDLNICGKILQIPNGSYMRLNLGYPDAFDGLTEKEDVTFKLYHFKRDDATGALDYANPEEIACVLTPYGIIAQVNSFSPYVLVAVDNSQLPADKRDAARSIALVCNGHGGAVTGTQPVVSLTEGRSAAYTLTPDAGFEVEFVRLNGTDIPFEGNTVTLAYDALEGSNTLEVGFVASAVKEAETEAGIEPLAPSAMCTVRFETNGGSTVASAHVKEYDAVEKPADPTRSGYRFDGWFTDQALTDAYDFATPVAANITLYAKWTKVSTGGTHRPSRPSTPSTAPSEPPAASEEPPKWVNPFGDVKETDWYYSAVGFASTNGFFRGTEADKFTPGGEMTRGMLATVLHRLSKEPEVGVGRAFRDVAEDQYYAQAVAWAASRGIVNGYGDGTFGPDKAITREQLAAMLWRYAGSPAGVGSLEGFVDADKIDPWAVDALEWAVERKLVNGKGGGVLDPDGTATRAEVAAMLMRYVLAAEK